MFDKSIQYYLGCLLLIILITTILILISIEMKINILTLIFIILVAAFVAGLLVLAIHLMFFYD